MSKREKDKENVFATPKQNYFIRCPYDGRHFVLAQNYENHLPVCARKHPNVHVMFCPFNTSHRCRTLQQLSEHIERCPFQELYGQYAPKENSR